MINVDIDLDGAKENGGRLLTLQDDNETTTVNIYLTDEAAQRLKEML